MKIRNSFVSNSSSASYIIKIYTDKETFYKHVLREYSYEFFSKEVFTKLVSERLIEYNNRIKNIEKEIEEQNLGKEKIFRNFFNAKERLNEYKESIADFEKLLTKIESFDDEKIVDEVLKYRHIELKELKNDKIELSYFTSMHNSFEEGMSDVLKEIVLYFLFDTDIKIKCERIDDH